MTTVATTLGSLRGIAASDHQAFLGIPYAAAPVGALRWAAPAPVAPWSGVREATSFGPAAWQPTGGPLDGLVPGMGSADQGDDCLSLNIWTPATDDTRRPVMVWIHGGAFSLGAGSLSAYDGRALCTRTDTVVVTINYRVGALGFLVLDDDSAVANAGILDQIAALRWVRDNIAAFGGDPDRVTIFGESAGGGSVLSLLSAPDAQGLFHRAIVQSGATDLMLDRDRARLVLEAFARCAGVDPDDTDALRALEPAQVLAAQAQAAGELFATVGTMPFHPCVDGEVLPTTWQQAAEAGVSTVPLIIGTTRDEMALFAGFDPGAASLDGAGLRARLERMGPDVDAIIDAYASTGTTEPPAVWSRITTDNAMWRPALRYAEAHATHGPVWMYRFDWTAARPELGAPHGVDIPFPFDTIDVGGWDAFVSDPAAAHGLARTIGDLWSSFARTGAPTSGDLDWPPFDTERRATLVLGPEVQIIEDPNGAVRRVWG
ncbi:MAG: carboxylesterase/lipase family protein [Acidobacteria bacterium]|nr:carboxylesterase/lipase family protein [Acidobacteriota bacterium]